MNVIADDSRLIIIFCLIVFVITYILEVGMWLSGILQVRFASLVLASVMFIPLFSAVITVKYIERTNLREYGIVKGRIKYYVYSLVFPFIVIILGLLFVLILETTPINFTLANVRAVVPDIPFITEISMELIVIYLILAPFIYFLPAFGEEYGWRGFLLPKMIKHFNLLGGLLLTGVIWGLWHAPLILMGYNYPHHTDVIGITAFTVNAILIGFFLGWIRLKSKSVFPAALCHGAINAYFGLGLVVAPAGDELRTIPLGIPGILALFIFAVLVYIDLLKSNREKFTDK
jgi:membrane protease YdiL (CAAX protease family)